MALAEVRDAVRKRWGLDVYAAHAVAEIVVPRFDGKRGKLAGTRAVAIARASGWRLALMTDSREYEGYNLARE